MHKVIRPKCPYCGRQSELVGGKRIYPHRRDLYLKRFYLCEPCNAYVGCQPNTCEPLGRLANAELRALKMQAHASFDPLWKEGHMTRTDAYKWLAKELSIPRKDCHIGMFDPDMCRKVTETAQWHMADIQERIAIQTEHL